MSVWRQMQNAVASREPVLVPTSLATANRVSRMPHIVANACYPWRIIDANAAFSQLTGYMREEAIGSTLGLLLEGDATDISVVEVSVRWTSGGALLVASWLPLRSRWPPHIRSHRRPPPHPSPITHHHRPSSTPSTGVYGRLPVAALVEHGGLSLQEGRSAHA